LVPNKRLSSDAEEQGKSNGAIHFCQNLNFGVQKLCQSKKTLFFDGFYDRPRPNDVLDHRIQSGNGTVPKWEP
jgi:hypothetical protein